MLEINLRHYLRILIIFAIPMTLDYFENVHCKKKQAPNCTYVSIRLALLLSKETEAFTIRCIIQGK